MIWRNLKKTMKFKRMYHESTPAPQKRRDLLLTIGVISACFALSFQMFVLHKHHEMIDGQLKRIADLIDDNTNKIIENKRLIDELAEEENKNQ
jgi:hypothetical protein